MIARSGGFLFYVGRPFVGAGSKAGKMPALHGLEAWTANVGRPFVVARYEAGKMPALQVAKNYQKIGFEVHR